MNDGQNNNGGVAPVIPITPITPTQPQVSGDSTNSSVQTSTGPVPNLTPVDIVSASSNDNGKIDVVNPVPTTGGGESKILMPNTVLPEVKGSASSVSEPVASVASVANNTVSGVNASSSQLNLENSSPFDIGVNAPISTNLSNVNAPQGGMSTIPVVNNSNVDNNKVSDINIVQSNNISDDVVSVKTYVINMILFSIPLVGFIVLLIRAFDNKNKSLSNFAKAYLLFGVIMCIVFVLLIFVFGFIGANIVGSGLNY